MQILIEVERKLGSVFNIMAFIRTVICIIIVVCAMSCGVIVVLPQDSYDRHLIHFHQDGIEIPTCEWCSAYSDDDEE